MIRWMLCRESVQHKTRGTSPNSPFIRGLYNSFTAEVLGFFVDSNWVEQGHIATSSKKDPTLADISRTSSLPSFFWEFPCLKPQQTSHLLKSHPHPNNRRHLPWTPVLYNLYKKLKVRPQFSEKLWMLDSQLEWEVKDDSLIRVSDDSSIVLYSWEKKHSMSTLSVEEGSEIATSVLQP